MNKCMHPVGLELVWTGKNHYFICYPLFLTNVASILQLQKREVDIPLLVPLLHILLAIWDIRPKRLFKAPPFPSLYLAEITDGSHMGFFGKLNWAWLTFFPGQIAPASTGLIDATAIWRCVVKKYRKCVSCSHISEVAHADLHINFYLMDFCKHISPYLPSAQKSTMALWNIAKSMKAVSSEWAFNRPTG